jgi:hypothetical protein
MRRKFFEVYVALKSPIAKEALERFGELYRIEDESADLRPRNGALRASSTRCRG